MSERIGFADFHIHTRESVIRVGSSMIAEGVLSTPTEVVRRAYEVGLSCIAITDHNTLGGIPEALEAGEEFKVKIIPGIEISAEEGKRTPHVLGLGIDYKAKNVPIYEPALTVMNWIRDNGGDVIIPHPTRLPSSFSFGLGEVKRLRSWINGVEVCNWWKGLDNVIVDLARGLDLVMTGGSDSHILETIGLVQIPIMPEVYDNRNSLKAVPNSRLPGRIGDKGSYIKSVPGLISFGVRLLINTRGNPFIG